MRLGWKKPAKRSRPGADKRIDIQHEPRRNNRIRAREILLIGSDGQKHGVVKIEDAIARARQEGLDLIEVAPNANPPVCKIVDYGKYRYQQAKQERESRRHSSGKVKEIKFRPNIAAHDYQTKLRNGEIFLDKGMKLKLTLMFRGRELQHVDLGFDLMKRVCQDLLHIGHVEAEPKKIGKSITAMVAPLPESKRVLKYSQKDDEAAEDDDGDDASEAA